MATKYEAVDQLSKDLGDYFSSTTTGDGAADGSTLVDARLGDEDDDVFVTDHTMAFIQGGQSGGPTSDEERAVASVVGSTGTLTMQRAWSMKIVSGITWSAHRRYSFAEKEVAIDTALYLCFPTLWAPLTQDITMVADQYDYDLTSYGFYQNKPKQVRLVSSGDSEVDYVISAYELWDGKLHLLRTPSAGETLRLIGTKIPTIADIEQPKLLILTARAAMYLLEQTMSEAPDTQLVARATQMLSLNAQRYVERVSKYAEAAPATTVLTEAYEDVMYDKDWSIP